MLSTDTQGVRVGGQYDEGKFVNDDRIMSHTDLGTRTSRTAPLARHPREKTQIYHHLLMFTVTLHMNINTHFVTCRYPHKYILKC